MKTYWQLREEFKPSFAWDAEWRKYSNKFGGYAALVKKLRGGWAPSGVYWSKDWAEEIIRVYRLEKNSSESGNSSKSKKLNPSDFRNCRDYRRSPGGPHHHQWPCQRPRLCGYLAGVADQGPDPGGCAVRCTRNAPRRFDRRSVASVVGWRRQTHTGIGGK